MDATISAGFLGQERRSFYLSIAPQVAPLGHILYVPPFAEEMNRCRAIVAEQCRLFVDRGYLCTVLDFFGTGEAEGRLEDATLEDWQRNISDAIALAEDLPLTLWGCRLGALLAADFMACRDDLVADLLLWQPVSSGQGFVNQLFRQRSAALLERGLPKESKDDIRQRLNKGETLEVGGYALGGELLHRLAKLELGELQANRLHRVWWLEHQTPDDRPIPPKTQRAIDQLSDQCDSLDLLRFGGPPLWQLHERDRCEPLLEATQGCLL